MTTPGPPKNDRRPEPIPTTNDNGPDANPRLYFFFLPSFPSFPPTKEPTSGSGWLLFSASFTLVGFGSCAEFASPRNIRQSVKQATEKHSRGRGVGARGHAVKRASPNQPTPLGGKTASNEKGENSLSPSLSFSLFRSNARAIHLKIAAEFKK